MAGTFTLILEEGALPTSTGVLYTCPAATQTVIKSITIVNMDSSALAVNLFLNNGGGNRCIIPFGLSISPQYLVETDLVYTLNAGDTIEGDASTGSVGAYTISGIEET